MLLLGGGLTRDGATFGRRMLVLPARKVRLALPLIADLYRDTRQAGESFEQWARRIDRAEVVRVLEPLTKKDPTDAEIFMDAGTTEPYTHSL